jgi:SAM-dependent methyltransferase
VWKLNFSYSQILKEAHYHKIEQKKIRNLLKIFKSKRGAVICDVGFGLGNYLDFAKEIGYNTYGVDVNPHYVIQAIKNGHHAFLAGDYSNIGKMEFDLVLMSHVIEHLEPDALLVLIKQYVGLLKPDGILIIASPLLGDRFFYDISHVRPYYPQSIWHAFGQNSEELSTERTPWKLELIDINFIKDSFRTRLNRSYYVRDYNLIWFSIMRIKNYLFALIYLVTGARFGIKASWIGVYKKVI